LIPEKFYGGLYYNNKDLGKLYASSLICLNDHHDDMRREGFLNNRILDVYASGGFVISDNIKGIESIFGDILVRYKDPEHLQKLIKYYISHPKERENNIKKGQMVARRFTFAKMAEKIIFDLGQTASSSAIEELSGLKESISENRDVKHPIFTKNISYEERGEIYYNEGKLEDAENCFKKALGQNSRSSDAAYGMAKVFIKKGRKDDAISALKKCMHFDPHFIKAKILLKQLLLEYIPSKKIIKKCPGKYTFIHFSMDESKSFPEMTPAVIVAFDVVSKHNRDLSLLVSSRLKLEYYPWEIIEIVKENNQITFNENIGEFKDIQKGFIFIYPTKTENYLENIIYALSSGTPVITTAQAAKDIIKPGYNGILVDAKEFREEDGLKYLVNLNDLSSKIHFLGNDLELASEMASNCLIEKEILEKIRHEAG
jgi:glycosyltransferase involved in cell wall biosynthesis